MNILHANSEDEIAACFPAFKVLRPHLEESDFVSRVVRQQAQGYCLCYIRDSGIVVAAAGYRLLEFLAWGKILYIDDLITLPANRGNGFAGALMDFLVLRGRELDCQQLHLDSGYQRNEAHRLYLKKGMHLDCHHFAIHLNPN